MKPCPTESQACGCIYSLQARMSTDYMLYKNFKPNILAFTPSKLHKCLVTADKLVTKTTITKQIALLYFSD